MQRREFIKVGGVGLGTIALGGTVGGLALLNTACPFNSGNLVSWTEDIVSALNAASPLLSTLGVPNVIALVADAVTIANDLKTAFASSNTTGAVALFDKLDAVFIKITTDIGIIPIALRVPIESVLALASIAIHLIADHLKTTVVAVGMKSEVMRRAAGNPQLLRGVAKINLRADEKPWGDLFKKK